MRFRIDDQGVEAMVPVKKAPAGSVGAILVVKKKDPNSLSQVSGFRVSKERNL